MVRAFCNLNRVMTNIYAVFVTLKTPDRAGIQLQDETRIATSYTQSRT